MSLAVIIPSRSANNLSVCLHWLRENEPGMPVVIVSDSLEFGALTAFGYDKVDVIPGLKPFVFARNINLGIEAAKLRYSPTAYILLNDDALLMTPLGFTRLAQESARRPDYGIISAVTNCVGNENQITGRNTAASFRDEPKMLCFVAVLVTAAAVERVGMLDERFTAYGWEDNDYSRRVREAGLKLGVSEHCFVDHTSLVSTYRGNPKQTADINAGAAIYRAKWGDLR